MTDPRVTFKEMSDQEFNQWRQSPVTAAFLTFLKHQEDNYRATAMGMWEQGRLGQHSDELRGRVLALSEVTDLRLQTIQEFYSAEENNEAKTP